MRGPPTLRASIQSAPSVNRAQSTVMVRLADGELAGRVSQEFADLVWRQVEDKVRGETSLDAYELRKVATTSGPEAEKARHEYLLATFADAIAVYTLSLYLDVDYQDLRERDYPLLAPSALAERLRKVNELFPPNPGYEFGIYHRRRQ